MKRIGIINVNLEYEIPEHEDAQAYLENIELPKEYVADSFEIKSILVECPYCKMLEDEDHICMQMRNKSLA